MDMKSACREKAVDLSECSCFQQVQGIAEAPQIPATPQTQPIVQNASTLLQVSASAKNENRQLNHKKPHEEIMAIKNGVLEATLLKQQRHLQKVLQALKEALERAAVMKEAGFSNPEVPRGMKEASFSNTDFARGMK